MFLKIAGNHCSSNLSLDSVLCGWAVVVPRSCSRGVCVGSRVSGPLGFSSSHRAAERATPGFVLHNALCRRPALSSRVGVSMAASVRMAFSAFSVAVFWTAESATTFLPVDLTARTREVWMLYWKKFRRVVHCNTPVNGVFSKVRGVVVLADDILKNVEYDAIRIVHNKFCSIYSNNLSCALSRGQLFAVDKSTNMH